MSYKTESLLLLLLFFFLSFQSSLSDDPLFHFCFSKENFTEGGPYKANLESLLNALAVKTPPTGFGLASIGGPGGPGGSDEVVNGVALCRGDVSSPNCNSCVVEAGRELRQRCPTYKGAVIWYDYCLVKYSNERFFGKIDTRNRFYMWNVMKVDDPAPFNVKVKELLTGLANKAYTTPKLYASGELVLDIDKTLYGMVQCARDLTFSDCKKCLDGSIGELIDCCDGKRGGRVVGPSCNFRYELYPFLDA